MAILQIDDKHQTIHGILLIFVSGCLLAILSFLIEWYSEKRLYSMREIFLYLSVLQLLFALILSTVKWRKELNVNMKNMLLAIKSINNFEYLQMIYTRRVSIYSPKKSIMKPLRDSTSSTYGSMTTLISTQHLIYNPNPSIQNNNTIEPHTNKRTYSRISQYFIEEITPKKIWITILFRGIFGAFSIQTFLLSIESISVLHAFTLQSFSVVISTITGYIVLDDPISICHIIAMFCSIISILMIVQPLITYNDEANTLNKWNGYLLSVISSVCTGIVLVSIRIVRKVPVFLLITSECVCNIIGCILMIVFCSNIKLKIYHGYKDVLYMLCLGGILYFYSFALTKGSQKLMSGAVNIIQIGSTVMFCVIMQILMSSICLNAISISGIVLSTISNILIVIEKIKMAHNKPLFEMPDTNHHSQCGDIEKDVIDTYYAFDEDEYDAFSTLIM
eukprot:38332_1